jgi:hypothetical protein
MIISDHSIIKKYPLYYIVTGKCSVYNESDIGYITLIIASIFQFLFYSMETQDILNLRHALA